jgi:putative membrane protein
VTGPPGLAADRTDLAWQRTGLGVLAAATLLGVRAVTGDRPLLLLAAGAVALGGLAVLGILGPLRSRQVQRRLGRGADVASPRAMTAVTGAVVLAGLAAAIDIVMPR